jgi:hypothetical protein
LSHTSRPIEDWVIDNLISPESYGDFFSIGDCIKYMPEDFEFLGCSPSMFYDVSWYKDNDFKLKEELIRQFNIKRHNLMFSDLKVSERSEPENEKLLKFVTEIRTIVESNQNVIDGNCMQKILDLLSQIKQNVQNMDPSIQEAISEVFDFLKEKNFDISRISNMTNFKNKFGRGQQYVSMVKRFTY